MSQADWDRLLHYSRKVKFFEVTCQDSLSIHPSTYFRIAELRSSALFPSLRRLSYSLVDLSISVSIFLFLSPLLESLELFDIEGFEDTIIEPFLATVSSQMLRRIVLENGNMSVDIFKNSIVHFKQLRSLELLDAVFMDDFVLLEVLGTLPSLANFTLQAINPKSHPARALENSNSQSGSPKYFEALESLCVTGSFFLIQHLLGFIDSPCLNSIEVYPVINPKDVPEDLFTPSLTIVASKWSHSLNNLVIESSSNGPAQRYPISKCLVLLTDLHEMQTFRLQYWRMIKNSNDGVRRLVKSWPKLRTLNLDRTPISLSTLRIIAENCPDLRHLYIRLDSSSIPPLDASSKSLHHNLEVLTVVKAAPPTITQTILEYQMQVTRHLDLIFPYMKSIEVDSKDAIWLVIRDLVLLCQGASLSRVK